MLIIILALLLIILFITALVNIKKKLIFQETKILSILGIFVWGDALVLLPFWFTILIFWIIFRNVYFIYLLISLFWVIRSFGEIIYWLNQQFSNLKRNPPEKLLLHNLIQNDAIWFIYQVFWQCIFVFAVAGAILFGYKWVMSL